MRSSPKLSAPSADPDFHTGRTSLGLVMVLKNAVWNLPPACANLPALRLIIWNTATSPGIASRTKAR